MRRVLSNLIGLAAVLIFVPMFVQPVKAQTASDDYNPNVNYDCDHNCLIDDMNQVLAAMVAHDASTLPLARDVKYTEDGQVLKLTDGFWETASALPTNYKTFIADPQSGEVGIMAMPMENGAPVLLCLRLKVQLRKISEIEAIIIRPDAAGAARIAHLANNPVFEESVPPSERRSRQNMIAIMNSYFSGIENDTGKRYIPFADDAIRLENGNQTCPSNPNVVPNAAPGANVPRPPPPAPGTPGSLSCADQINLGNFREDTLLRDRRYPVIDEERGLILGYTFFDHNATVREWKLTDGRERKATRTSPWAWEIVELFKISDGKIIRIEALVNAVPYGMKAGW
ncbi:MAG: hypothetical protein WA581_09455 [Candidatus Acidiferrales bacterium]